MSCYDRGESAVRLGKTVCVCVCVRGRERERERERDNGEREFRIVSDLCTTYLCFSTCVFRVLFNPVFCIIQNKFVSFIQKWNANVWAINCNCMYMHIQYTACQAQ